jgi:hypothetical protein
MYRLASSLRKKRRRIPTSNQITHAIATSKSGQRFTIVTARFITVTGHFTCHQKSVTIAVK